MLKGKTVFFLKENKTKEYCGESHVLPMSYLLM